MKGTWQGSGTWKSSGPDPGPVMVVIAVLILAGSGVGSAIASAVVTLLIVIGVLVGLAVVAGIALLVYRVRRARHARRVQPVAARPVYQVPPAAPRRLEGPERPAIGPPREVHYHFHVSPDELAAIMRRHGAED